MPHSVNIPEPTSLQCPSCGKSRMIQHRDTLVKNVHYKCPTLGCPREYLIGPPEIPPTQPGLPPGNKAEGEKDAPPDAVARAA